MPVVTEVRVAQSRSRSLFSRHGWIARWGAIATTAGFSVIAGLCMVALFITPSGVRELSTPQLLGMAGLFVLPVITLAALHWERRSRGLAMLAASAHTPKPILAPTPIAEAADTGTDEEAQLAAELDRVLPWIVPDLPSPRTGDAQRHRRRITRTTTPDARELFCVGRGD